MRPPEWGLDATRRRRGASRAEGRAAEGDHPAWQGAERPKAGETAARAEPLPRSREVRRRVRAFRGPWRPAKGEAIGRRRDNPRLRGRDDPEERRKGSLSIQGRENRINRPGRDSNRPGSAPGRLRLLRDASAGTANPTGPVPRLAFGGRRRHERAGRQRRHCPGRLRARRPASVARVSDGRMRPDARSRFAGGNWRVS